MNSYDTTGAAELARLALEKADVQPQDNIFIEGETAVAEEIRKLLGSDVNILTAEAMDAAQTEEERPNVVFITRGAEGVLEKAARAITPAGRIILTGAESAQASYNVLAASHRELLIQGVCPAE